MSQLTRHGGDRTTTPTKDTKGRRPTTPRDVDRRHHGTPTNDTRCDFSKRFLAPINTSAHFLMPSKHFLDTFLTFLQAEPSQDGRGSQDRPNGGRQRRPAPFFWQQANPSHCGIVTRMQLRTHATQTQAQSKSISRFGGCLTTKSHTQLQILVAFAMYVSNSQNLSGCLPLRMSVTTCIVAPGIYGSRLWSLWGSLGFRSMAANTSKACDVWCPEGLRWLPSLVGAVWGSLDAKRLVRVFETLGWCLGVLWLGVCGA